MLELYLVCGIVLWFFTKEVFSSSPSPPKKKLEEIISEYIDDLD
jgi:hypothetical protein